MYVSSFNKELFSKIRGCDEHTIGWGGHEENITTRYRQVGGKIAMNTSIYSAQLPNFPRELPPGIIKRHTGGHWQEDIIINDENWGISEKMEDINLYK